MLSGIKDIDMKILDNLEDYELYDICIVNKYAVNLCNEDSFWRNRFIKNFSLDILDGKPDDMSWKEYYIELSNWDDLEKDNQLYYLTPSGKLFFNNTIIKDFKGNPINDQLIEKSGISSIYNLKTLFSLLKERDFKDAFFTEFERLRITDDFLSRRNIDRLIPKLLGKPLRTDTLFYSKMYNLYSLEKKFLKEIK